MRVEWCGGEQPAGETQNRPFQLRSTVPCGIDFQGAWVTSDSGLPVALGLTIAAGSSEIWRNIIGERVLKQHPPPGTCGNRRVRIPLQLSPCLFYLNHLSFWRAEGASIA